MTYNINDDNYLEQFDIRCPIIKNVNYYYFGKLLVKKTKNSYETIYKYDFFGNLISETSSDTVIKYQYDDNSNIIERSTYLTKFRISIIRSYTYNTDNKVTSIYDSKNGNLNYYENMYYNEKGLLIKHNMNGRIEYLIYNNAGKLIKKLNKSKVLIFEYFYDELGKLIKENNELIFTEILYSYFANGQLKLKIIQEHNYYIERPSTIKEYYNDKEKVIKIETYFENPLKPFSIKVIDYDQNNKIKKIAETGKKDIIINNSYIQLK